MRRTVYKWILPIDSACARDSGSDHTLTGDNHADGTLILLAENANLVDVTSANGSVAEAGVKGDVFLLMGDPSVTSSADMGDDAYALTGTVFK